MASELKSRLKTPQSEQWVEPGQSLVVIGFQDDDNEQIIYLPLSDLKVKARTLQNSYHTKVIITRASGKMLSIDVPVIMRKSQPWAKWVVYQNVTRESGLIHFQVRAINACYRLLKGTTYRGIIFEQV